MRQSLFQALLISSLAALAAAAVFQIHPRSPSLYLVQEPLKADQVSLHEIRERWNDDVIWLDARPRDQFDAEHIPGALLLNEQEFDPLLLGILDTLQAASKPIIIYCGGQKCNASRHVREKLRSMVPLDDCYILQGGWPAWKAVR